MSEESKALVKPDLSQAIDASVPGVLDFGRVQLINLGGGVWLVAGSGAAELDLSIQGFKRHFPDAKTIGIYAPIGVTFTALEQSRDLVDLIRKIVREELLKETKGGADV